MTQSDEMLKWAGNNWLTRNKKDLGKNDPIWKMLPGDIKPSDRILEVGCSNGWRLKKIKDKFCCQVYGIDPSEAAVAEANIRNEVKAERGIASALPYFDNHFSIVIMGFCLWLIEPREWFKVVAETDRVLKDKGVLIIHDYVTPRPFRSPYMADGELVGKDLWTFHCDWPKLWLAHPCYSMIGEHIHRIPAYEMVCILRKNMTALAAAE